MAVALKEIRYSARSFARTPGLTLALLISIALGVGSNAAVHGFANGLIARDGLRLKQDRVVSLFVTDAQRVGGAFSYDEYLSVKAQSAVFEWIGVARETRGTLFSANRSAIVAVASVTPELAGVFDLALGGPVISHRLWQSEFNGRLDVRGTQIRVADLSDRVNDVAPEWLEGLYAGSAVDVWMPLRDESLETEDRTSRSYRIFARLRSGVSVAQARAALNGSRDGSSAIGVARYTGMTPEMSDGFSRMSTVLVIASAAVFFIACANVASFLLGRASARSQETSVRVALGAGRGQLARQLLSDSVLISVTGVASGLLLALWTSSVIPAFLFQEDAEHLVFAPDASRILLTAALCGVVTIACGLLPMLEMRTDRPAAVLQRESSGPSGRTRRLRAGLVVAQMTCCCVLVISTAFLLQGFRASLRTAPGREVSDAILATVHTSPVVGLRYFEDIEAAAVSMAGVFESTWVGRLPGAQAVWQSLRIEPANVPLREVTVRITAFTPESHALVRLPPVSGRMFGIQDTAQSCRVAIVNEEAADEMFGGNAAGRLILDSAGQPVEIIGVVAARRKGEDVPILPTLYYYPEQNGEPYDWFGPSRVRASAVQNLATAVLDVNIVSPDYFDRMGFRMILPAEAGGDEKATVASALRRKVACRVAVVNQQAAERYFGGDPIGTAVIDSSGRRTEIVGVVQSPPLQTFQRAAEPAIYYPMAEDFTPRMTLILRAGRVGDDWLASLRRRLEVVRGGFSPPIVKTLDTHLRQTALAPLRIATLLVSAFAATAVALGVLGLYSALSDAARQRRREIALRIALGAYGWRVIRQLVEEGARLAAAGTAAGMLMSLLAVRLLRGVAPNGSPVDVWIWLAAPVVLLGAVALASVIPAFRALAVDPLVITRADN
ncbi:MAG: ABC transporter permease [Vicinamibacterales bacterium]